MPDIRIANTPIALKDEIWRRKLETYRKHEAIAPFAFPSNLAETALRAAFESAFKDDAGRPAAKSPIIFSAFFGDRFCGYVQLSEAARILSEPFYPVHINDIWVLPEFRGKGVARALLDHVKELSKKRDWDNLGATVWVGNEASERLFESAGFSIESKSYRFGPTRPARALPVPPRKRSRFASEFQAAAVPVIGMLLIALLIGLLN